jgi:hypothetical protein
MPLRRFHPHPPANGPSTNRDARHLERCAWNGRKLHVDFESLGLNSVNALPLCLRARSRLGLANGSLRYMPISSTSNTEKKVAVRYGFDAVLRDNARIGTT